VRNLASLHSSLARFDGRMIGEIMTVVAQTGSGSAQVHGGGVWRLGSVSPPDSSKCRHGRTHVPYTSPQIDGPFRVPDIRPRSPLGASALAVWRTALIGDCELQPKCARGSHGSGMRHFALDRSIHSLSLASQLAAGACFHYEVRRRRYRPRAA
jgi:hypothetical protein